jgi:hypothetical protein
MRALRSTYKDLSDASCVRQVLVDAAQRRTMMQERHLSAQLVGQFLADKHRGRAAGGPEETPTAPVLNTMRHGRVAESFELDNVSARRLQTCKLLH